MLFATPDEITRDSKIIREELQKWENNLVLESPRIPVQETINTFHRLLIATLIAQVMDLKEKLNDNFPTNS